MQSRLKNQTKLLHRFKYPTSDNWSPNFIRNCVELSVYLYPTKTMIRITVYGADDTGMEKDIIFTQNQCEEEINKIEKWFYTLPNPLTMQWLRDQGFKAW